MTIRAGSVSDGPQTIRAGSVSDGPQTDKEIRRMFWRSIKQNLWWIVAGVYLMLGVWWIFVDTPYSFLRWRNEWSAISFPTLVPGLAFLIVGLAMLGLETWLWRNGKGISGQTRILVNSVPPLMLLVQFILSIPSTYAVCFRDFEIEFVVIDNRTKAPIPGATIDWRVERELMEQEKQSGRPTQAHLVTNEAGQATLKLKDLDCEDVIREFRKTITLFVLPHTVDVSADGYWPMENESLIWSDRVSREDLGYFSERAVQRVRVKLPLRKTK